MSGSGSGGSSRRRGGIGGGTGGGGATGGGPMPGSGGTDCSQLAFETTVSSPDPAVLATLTVGDVCNVDLLQNPPRIAITARPNGEVLGGIGNRWEELMGCLSQGVQFVAEVRSVASPVRVFVRPAF